MGERCGEIQAATFSDPNRSGREGPLFCRDDLSDQSDPEHGQGSQEAERFQSHRKKNGSKVERSGVLQAQVSGIGAEGGELNQCGLRPPEGRDTGCGQGDYIGEKEVAVVHMGKEQRYSKRQDGGGSKEKLCVYLPSEAEQQQQ